MCYNTRRMSENSYQKSFRTKVDSMGQVNVPSEEYWGTQTQRALHHFPTGKYVMPYEVIYSLAIIKKCAAIVNSLLQYHGLDFWFRGLIETDSIAYRDHSSLS